MFGFLKGKGSAGGGGTAPRRTNRTDWDAVLREVYSRVIAGTKFGIGVLTVEKGQGGGEVTFRLNQEFPEPQVTDYVRRAFKPAHFDRFFSPGGGLAFDRKNRLFQVKGTDFGLPAKTLVGTFEHASDTSRRGLVVFGGARLEGQLETRISALETVLGSSGPTVASKDGPPVASHAKLVETLGQLNLKRLFDYEITKLAEIVNGLEETKEELSTVMKPRFTAVSRYVFEKRMGNKGGLTERK